MTPIAVIRGGEPAKLMHGVNNAINWAQNSTYMLQNLKGKVPGWKAWWDERVAEMQADPLMQFFHRLRSEILKAARVNIVLARLKNPVPGDLLNEVGPRPHPDAQPTIAAKRGWFWRFPGAPGEWCEQDGPWPTNSCGPRRINFADLSTGGVAHATRSPTVVKS